MGDIRQPKRIGEVKCHRLRLRKSPYSEDDNVLALLEENQRVTIVDELDEWFQVSSSKGHGYVKKMFIREV